MNKPVIVAKFYRGHNRLLEKAGGIGANAETASFSPETIDAANQHYQEEISDYSDWIQTTLNKLTALVEVCVNFPDKRRSLYKQIQEISHEMKGQGGTFGYPLVSIFGSGLYDYTGENAGVSDNHVRIIKAHAEAIRTTINERVLGDGGQIGVDLKTTVSAVIKRFA